MAALRQSLVGIRALRSLSVARVAAARGYADAPAEKITLTLSAPHTAYYSEQPVSQVNVPSSSGDFGILPNHVPALSTLKPGVVSVFETADAEKKFFVSSGTVTVNADSTVQILAEEAVPLEELDLSAARSGLDKFTSQLASASGDVAKAEAEIGVEVYSAIIKALE